MFVQSLFDELREDFPEFSNSIESIEFMAEFFFELVQDYHHCKQQVLLLEEQNNHHLAHLYRLTLDELKMEIRDFLAWDDPPQNDLPINWLGPM